ncbi:hypothetical protein BDB00DRAFT_629023 [Zychaea mexicana]|uniref:uncharacterized protein n=1 Tax=Zychaea mexicana TaxID=64656 RepID=UPI0022FF3711|nr:uncharacterized protein BDB00DRAFT_629023 [Zychaea mexicana]KAI9497555.1 hypothetical protein BDB00DRAFT_629023 [Zychaea mexicana]
MDSPESKAHKLSSEDKKLITAMYKRLDEERMWRLSMGTIVEKQMEKVAAMCNHEHLSHSLILDPQDNVWALVFTEKEIQEIKSHQAPKLKTMPDEMNEYIAKYKGLVELEAIEEVNAQHRFSRLKEPYLHWMSTSIAKVLDLLYYNYLGKERSESDLLKHVWTIIDCCFYHDTIDVFSGEQKSKSTNNRVNNDRSVAAQEPCQRRKVGSKTDLLFATDVVELGTAEAGKDTDINSTKMISESGFKTPKVLKDMLYHMVKETPAKL